MNRQADRGPLPHWNLSSIYPSPDDEQFQADTEQLKTMLDEMDVFLDENHIARDGQFPAGAAQLAQVIAGYLDRMNAIVALYTTMAAYLNCIVNTNSYDSQAKSIRSAQEKLRVCLENQEVRFSGWLGRVGGQDTLFADALAQPGPAQEQAFFLRETAEQSRYLMSEAEESLAAELALSGSSAWNKLQRAVTSQIKVPFERDGRVEQLPMTVIQNLASAADEATRRRAYQAEIDAWAMWREPLAACLNGVKGAVGTLDRRRGRRDALHASLDQARIDRETLEALLDAMSESFPDFRRYLRAKARYLGKERLAWWDLQAPVGRSEQSYTFPETRDFLLAQFASFSPRLVELARRSFDEEWIDAEPRDGKVGGAHCVRIIRLEESRVLCNFDGTLSSVVTVAHELGHAYHNACQAGLPPLLRRNPMTLAETASIFNQTIITEALLAQSDEPQELLRILENSLGDATQVIVDIGSRFLFEREVFERRAEAELSADDLCAILHRCQLATYGDGLDPQTLHPYMWAWKPHYYYAGLSFYNYPYAFGLLFGLGLYHIYREQGRAFLPAYDGLLRSTGQATAAELAGRFGIDLRRPSFWRRGLEILAGQVDRYEGLI